MFIGRRRGLLRGVGISMTVTCLIRRQIMKLNIWITLHSNMKEIIVMNDGMRLHDDLNHS